MHCELFLATHHYRHPWEFTYPEIEASLTACGNLKEAVQAPSGDGWAMDIAAAKERFEDALDNDLDAPAAVKVRANLPTAFWNIPTRGAM